MATEYVDAGTPSPTPTLSAVVGKRAAGGQGRHLRADPQRPRRAAQLAHLLRRLRRAALQPAGPDQHGATSASSSRSGCSRPARWACTRARRRTRSRPPRSSSTASCSSRAGTASVWALDARNGNELWRYRHASPFDVSLCCGNVNRGVAVAEGKVFMTTLNAHIIALDAETGKKVWDQTVRRRPGRRERHGRPADRQGHGHRRQLRRRVRRRAATPTRSSSRPASACGAAT